MITASELERASELKELLHNVHRKADAAAQPARPHLFHEQKDALGRAVIGLMDKCGFRPPPSPRAYAAAQADSGARFVHDGGRFIPVERKRSNVR